MPSDILKNRRIWVLVALALLPLLWLGTWSRHDWGDDFAQYLIQTRNMVEGRPQTDNGLVFPQSAEKYAVSAYPVGFPLLLLPVYSIAGLKIRPYLIGLSLVLIAAGLLLFEFYLRERSPVLAALMVLLFCFNKFVLEWKWQVLSDLPFLLLSVFCWARWRTTATGWKSLLSWSVFCGFVVSVRIVGMTLPLAMAAACLLDNQLEWQKRIRSALLLLLGTVTVFVVLNTVLFDVPIIDFAGFYSNALQRHGNAVVANLQLYRELAGIFFQLPLLHASLAGFWLLIALSYWGYKLLRFRQLPELFTGIYALVILFYPYQDGGFRFLLPIIPLLIGYLFGAMTFFVNLFPKPQKTEWLIILFACMLTAGNLEFVIKVAERPAESIQGPHDPAAKELFEEIGRNTPYSSLIAFNKPRALSLYTDRPTTCMARNADPDVTRRQFDQMGVDYIVLPTSGPGEETYAPDFSDYISRFRTEYDTAWSNERFLLLKTRR